MAIEIELESDLTDMARFFEEKLKSSVSKNEWELNLVIQSIFIEHVL